MIEIMLNNQWLQLLGLILTIATGIWFFWEKFFRGVKWLIKRIKNWITSIKNQPSNPFFYKGYISPDDFFGRKALLRQIFEELKKGTNLSLIGENEIGKTSLLHKVCQLGNQQLPEKIFIYLDMQKVTTEGDFFKSLCDKMNIPVCRSAELEQALQGKQYVLCLDFIERMKSQLFSGNERTELRGFAEGANAPLTLLIASHSSLNTLFPEDDSRLESSPLAGICHNIDILPFNQTEVRDFIQTRLQPTGQQFTEAEIAEIWQKTQGYPARIQAMAAQMYRQKFDV